MRNPTVGSLSCVTVLAAVALLAQTPEPAVPIAATASNEAGRVSPIDFEVDKGTKIPLSMINSISTKNAADGDKVYLETVFPIMSGGRVVIPPGSYVGGTVTHVKRPGKVKGRGEFYLRFDSLTLPNGVTRDFRASLNGLDGRASEDLDKKEGKISSEGDKAGDTIKTAQVAITGMGVGALAGQAAGNLGKGTMIGAAAGAGVALGALMMTRGPDAVLAKGTTVELVLDRTLRFEASEVDFSNQMPRATGAGSGPMPSRRSSSGVGMPGRFPY